MWFSIYLLCASVSLLLQRPSREYSTFSIIIPTLSLSRLLFVCVWAAVESFWFIQSQEATEDCKPLWICSCVTLRLRLWKSIFSTCRPVQPLTTSCGGRYITDPPQIIWPAALPVHQTELPKARASQCIDANPHPWECVKLWKQTEGTLWRSAGCDDSQIGAVARWSQVIGPSSRKCFFSQVDCYCGCDLCVH